MQVYRIVKNIQRARDLSGKGAFINGGRWNNPGTPVLYTSLNISLSLLETLVHTDESELPPNLFIVRIEIKESAPIYQFSDEDLPNGWREPENLELKLLGDKFFADLEFLGIKVRSAVLAEEWNILVNPLYPEFNDLVKISSIDTLDVDQRLL